MLGGKYRVVVYNNSGANMGANGTVTVKRRGWYINQLGVPIWETGASTVIFTNTSATPTGSTNTADATVVDNAGQANPYLGGEFECTFQAAGAATGTVSFVLQRAADATTPTWPDSGAPPKGEYIVTMVANGTNVVRDCIEYD